MLASLASCTLIGIDAISVEVEVDLSFGLPGYHVVGLPAPVVREGAVRIRSALSQVGHDLPNKKVTVNLAPAEIRKASAAFDLPIALGVLIGDGLYDPALLDRLVVLGELGLDGSLRPVKGALAAAILARQRGARGVLLPAASAAEARVVDGIEVHAAAHLGEVIRWLAGEGVLPEGARAAPRAIVRAPIDMSEVRGQDNARRATEIAVAGGHNLLFTGPPGIGKTMIARRVPTILPPMSREEALETTKVYSACGLADGLVTERPFRAPHNTVSQPALIGGGIPARPGEISLAHNGVLFLDELPEFARSTIEALRQPLEDRHVTIGRLHSTVRLPASFLLLASANPCPCGWAGSGLRDCTCGKGAFDRYQARLSGPILDRIDLQVGVRKLALSELRDLQPGESSEAIRGRVVAARERQRRRLAPWRLRSNAEMPPSVMRATCKLDAAGEAELAKRYKRGMTGRTVDRLLKIARTIADLDGRESIDADDVLEASTYRDVGVEDSRSPSGSSVSIPVSIGASPDSSPTATSEAI